MQGRTNISGGNAVVNGDLVNMPIGEGIVSQGDFVERAFVSNTKTDLYGTYVDKNYIQIADTDNLIGLTKFSGGGNIAVTILLWDENTYSFHNTVHFDNYAVILNELTKIDDTHYWFMTKDSSNMFYIITVTLNIETLEITHSSLALPPVNGMKFVSCLSKVIDNMIYLCPIWHYYSSGYLYIGEYILRYDNGSFVRISDTPTEYSVTRNYIFYKYASSISYKSIGSIFYIDLNRDYYIFYLDKENDSVKLKYSKSSSLYNYKNLCDVKRNEFYLCENEIYKTIGSVYQRDVTWSYSGIGDTSSVHTRRGYIKDGLICGYQNNYIQFMRITDDLNHAVCSNVIRISGEYISSSSQYIHIVPISNNDYVVFANTGYTFLHYEDDVLSIGRTDIVPYVKKYSGGKALGFAKTGGNQGETIKVYVPRTN